MLFIIAIIADLLVFDISKVNALSWNLRNIDVGGSRNAISIDTQGKIHTSYANRNNKLTYTTNASGSWIRSALNENASVGKTSIGLDNNDKVYISYYDSTNKDLKSATNISGVWVIETVDSVGDVGTNNDLKVGSDGKVRIIYNSKTDGSLKLAVQNGTGDWGISTVDNKVDIESKPAIALDQANKVHISYYDPDNDSNCLGIIGKYITNKSGAWVSQAIGVTGSVCNFSGYSDIAIDNKGKAHIGLYSPDKDAIYLTNSSGIWVKTLIKGEADVGKNISISLDENNKAYLSYLLTGSYYNYIIYANNASGDWLRDTVDTINYGAEIGGIVLDGQNKPYILYYYQNTNTLRLATKASDSLSPEILAITSSEKNGYYKANKYFALTVYFTKKVTSTGNIILKLNIGGSCSFNVSSSLVGVCGYTTKTGENTSKLTVSSITGIVKDSEAHALSSLIPIYNLGILKSIGIDTVAPVVTILSPKEGYYTTKPSVLVTGTISDNLSGVKTFTILDKPQKIQSKFTYLFMMSVGNSGLYYEATDSAGNTFYGYRSISRLNGDGKCNIINLRKHSIKGKIVTINVKIWKYIDKNHKKSSVMRLSVHRDCYKSVKRIFKRIYYSKDKPAIDTRYTGCYRSTSNYYYSLHKIGAACDINFIQNAQFRYSAVRKKWVPSVGHYWHPGNNPADKKLPGWSKGNDPRSISTKGSIPKAFWAENWGGQLIGDYMHFSLTGN